MTHGDEVIATFRPKRTDDLKPGVAELIGTRTRWHYMWTFEDDEDFAGQYAMGPKPALTTGDGHPIVWVLMEDLEDVIPVPRGDASGKAPGGRMGML